MQPEQRERHLIAVAMYYFGLADAGHTPRLGDFLKRLDPSLRVDLVDLIATMFDGRARVYETAEEHESSGAVVYHVLRELRDEL